MKNLSKGTLILFGLLIITLSFNLQTFAQDEAGEIVSNSGSKVMRIGILMPKVKLNEATGEMEPEEALRNTYAVLLNSDLFEVIALESKLTTLALNEATKKNCDYILNVDLEQIEKKSGGSKWFGKVARDAGNRATYETARKVPYGSGAGERIARSTAQSAIINTGYTLSDMTVEIKENDKFILNYNLTTAKGDAFYSNKIETKAKKNNDDVLMKLIEQSGEDIVKVLLKNLPQ